LGPLLTHIYIAENDETQMPLIAKNLLSMIFVEDLTAEQQQKFRDAFTWVAESDNILAIQNLVNDLVSKGKRYKKYDVDKIALGMMRQILDAQSKQTNSNKIAIELTVKQGIAALLE
jgi:aminopeptidase N